MANRKPRDYPETMPSSESGREMRRGEKQVEIKAGGLTYVYMQPGWWCSLTDPTDMEGQLVDEDNQVAEMARRSAAALAKGETYVPVVIRAIRERCGLSQREAGRVFGTGEKSFEKYESGEIKPSEPTKRLFKLAMERPDLFERPPRGKLALPTHSDAALIRRTLHDAAMDRIYGSLFTKRVAGERPTEDA